MLKHRFLSSFTAIFLACSFRAQAENETAAAADAPESAEAIAIEGDKLELQLDKNLRAIGNASISRGKQKILGDTIDYDVQNDTLHVMGHAQINVGDAKLKGPELHMQLSTSIGEIKDASISMTKTSSTDKVPANTRSSEAFSKNLGNLQSQQIGGDSAYSLTSKVIESTGLGSTSAPNSEANAGAPTRLGRGDAKAILFEGQDKKRLKDARFTTCAAGVDDWYIKAKELDLNDYTDSGIAKNATVEFKGVPILYTPWISFSFNNQRKSGLLAPTYGTTTKSGLELSVPFYWNISPNMDATLAMRGLSKRGVQLQGEFRYLEEHFSGIDNLEFLPSDNQTGQNRYYANLKHQHNLGSGWSAGYSLEKVSDDQYFSDLSTRIATTSRVTLPQQFNVDYVDDIWRFNALAQKFQTLDKTSYPYERLPQMTLKGNQDFGDFNANLYTQLVAFDTNKLAPTTVTGTRFSLYPSISLPMNTSYGFITPKMGIHHTTYSLNNDPNHQNSADRTLPIVSLDGGLFFDRNLTIGDGNYSQTIEPRMFYVYIPNSTQSNIPVFDTSESDLNFTSLFSENQFTGGDRINNANQLSLSLTSRLIESESGTQRLSALIGQRYYFADQKVALDYNNSAAFRKSNSSDIIAGLSTNLQSKWNLDAFWQYNTDTSRSVRTTVTSRYNPEPGKTLNLGYSYRKDIAGAIANAGNNSGINQIDISAQWPLGKRWSGIGRTNYSFQESRNIETIAGVEYNAGCWVARAVIQHVTTATADANTALYFQLELGGLASIGNNPLSVVKRSVPGYVSSGLIPNTLQQPYYE